MSLDVEQVDLATLAGALALTFEATAPMGFVRGRTLLRDAVAARLGCASTEAERLVDTMIGRGFLRFEGDPTSASEGDACWSIQPRG
jgi:hypothetical protein